MPTKYEHILNAYLDVALHGTVENMCGCPFCSGSDSLQFNSEKGLWICFRCGEKGSAASLVQRLGHTWVEPQTTLEEIDEELRVLTVDRPGRTAPIPDSYLRRFTGSRRIHQDWLDRGFTAATCERWELGYDAMSDRLTLPVRRPFTRDLAGIVYRLRGKLDPKTPRYRNPIGFQKSSALYGSWFVDKKRINSLVIVEGPTDAIKVDQAGVNVVAQYGSSLSVHQVKLLHQLGIESVCLFYDCDRPGMKVTEQAFALLEKQFSTTVVVWDKDVFCPDPQICFCKKNKHTWQEIHKCPAKRKCPCGKQHNADPGSLDQELIYKMVKEAQNKRWRAER